MGLRAKTLVVLVPTMLLLFAFLFGGAYVVLTTQYREIEEREAGSAADRSAQALENEIERIEASALDWAANDTTYELLQNRSDKRLIDTFSDQVLARHNINVAAVLDSRGKVIGIRAIDLDLGAGTQVQAGLAQELERETYLQKLDDPRGSVTGVENLPGGEAIIAAHSITSDDMYSAPIGTVVVLRYIDAAELESLSDVLDTKVTLQPSPTTIPETVIRTVAAQSVPSGTMWWEEHGASTMYAFALVDDVRGDPIFALRTEIRRDTRASLRSAITFAAISMLFICVVATGSVYLLLDWAIIDPLAKVTSQLKRIGQRGDPSARVDFDGGGELSQLTQSVNGMLVAMEADETELRRSRDELERRVELRTHELHVSDARHRELVEAMADAVFSVDLEGKVTSVNEHAVELAGRPREELVGEHFVELMTSGSTDSIERHLDGVPDRGESWTVEALLNSEGSDPIPVELRAAPFEDLDGSVAGTQWIARDITERIRYEAQLMHLATHDALTDLSNRNAFETTLEIELAEAMRTGVQGAVIWLDLDDFKDVNDTLGHAAGDEVLSMVANILSRNTRASNLLSRMGGDEFAIMMPRISREEAEAAAERILNAIVSYTFVINEHSVRIGASLGVVFFPENGTTVAEVLSNADAAMYRAKEGGRSMVWVSGGEGEPEQLHVSRMRWNERITAALAADAFVAFAQPITDLRTGEIAFHELLIRMRGDGDRLYPPSDFLPVAERLGLITEIDRWILREAISILESNDPRYPAVEVNLSAKAFANSEMVNFVADQLALSEIQPFRLGFEITETAAIADMVRAQWFIRELKELGCRFSLDDFGTGFSSFYYLKHLPLDCLKIDGSYVRGLAQSEEDRCLVRGICEMCRGLGIEVLAECVEDQATFDVVKSLGVDFAQGYHIGRPEPVVMRDREG